MIYASIYILFVLASLGEQIGAKQKRNVILLCCLGLVSVVLSGLRWNTGTDWIPYYTLFTNNSSIADFLAIPYEIGYLTLNYIIKLVANSYTVFLFVVASFVILLKYETIYKFSPYPFTVILANASFCALDLFTVRQGIAIALTLFSIRYVLKNEIYKFSFCLLLAASFHVTAIVFLAAYKIFHIKISNLRIFIGLLICLLLSLTVNINPIIINISGAISPNLLFMAETYAELDKGVASDIPLWIRKIFQFSKGITILIIFSWVLNRRISDTFIKGCFNLYATYVLILLLFSDIHPVFLRFGMYFSIFEIFIFPFLINSFKGKQKLIIWFIVLIYFISKFVYGFSSNWNLFFPYESIFNSSFKEVY